jgi:hypothetical protein
MHIQQWLNSNMKKTIFNPKYQPDLSWQKERTTSCMPKATIYAVFHIYVKKGR